MHQYVPIVVKIMPPTYATNVRWLSIAMPHVKRSIDQNIRNNVREE